MSYQARLKDIICASINLETLKLIKTEVYSNKSSERGIITLQKGDIMPQLKHLHLWNMHFDDIQSILWAECLQWELLLSLSLINGEWSNMIRRITGRLKSLKYFEVSISQCNPQKGYRDESSERPSPLPIYWERASQLQLLLESIPSLESFSGYYVPRSTLDTLSEFHHNSLKHLRFRTTARERRHPNHHPWPSGIEYLVNLAEQFPNLQSLGIDLDWENEEWVCKVSFIPILPIIILTGTFHSLAI